MKPVIATRIESMLPDHKPAARIGVLAAGGHSEAYRAYCVFVAQRNREARTMNVPRDKRD